jgi:hypothetical protein
METAPRDERILIDAELMSDQPENAFNSWICDVARPAFEPTPRRTGHGDGC